MSYIHKTFENLLATPAFLSERIGAPTVYWNGGPITTGPGGFDSKDYEDVLCAVNIGTVLGSLATIANSIYENDTDSSLTATAISGADFTSVNSASDESVRRGSVVCKDTKRYLFLRTEVSCPATTTPTIDFSAMWIAGNATSNKTEQHIEFDV